MASYKELLAQREQLDATIAAVREKEKAAVLSQIQEQIRSYGFTPLQVFPWDTEEKPVKKAVPAKYYDPDTGNSWTGRGRMPLWLKGKDLKQFELDRDEDETPAQPPAAAPAATQLSLRNLQPLPPVELAAKRHPVPSDAPKLEPRSLGPARRAPASQPASTPAKDWLSATPAAPRPANTAKPFNGPRSGNGSGKGKPGSNDKPKRDPNLVNPFPIQ